MESLDLSIRPIIQRSARVSVPRLAVREAADLALWRDQLRAVLHDLLNDEAVIVQPELRILSRVEEDEFSRLLVRYKTEENVVASAWLLIPQGLTATAPGVLALHGHGRGKDDVIGRSTTAEEANRIQEQNYDYARQLALQGYVVLAPDARGFGERSDTGCHITGLTSIYLGRPIVGQRLWDDSRALDLLESLPEVDGSRLACLGLSEGGKRTLFLAATDDRISCSVISGYFSSLLGEIEAWDRLQNWDLCNAVPGLLAWADLPDIAALIAPRHLMVQQGDQDGLYTQAAVKAGFETLTAVWARHRQPDRLFLEEFNGGHRWSTEHVYQWLAQHLGQEPPSS